MLRRFRKKRRKKKLRVTLQENLQKVNELWKKNKNEHKIMKLKEILETDEDDIEILRNLFYLHSYNYLSFSFF